MESYDALLNWAYDLQKFGIKLGLSSTENLLRQLGDPHVGLPSIHVGGTNGKGSVSAMVQAVLDEAGYRVGFYSSPHLVDFEERFRIGAVNCSKERVRDLMARVKAVCHPKEPPTFFEFTTAMAFLYFREENTDLAIMEVGLGGRLDSTNVVNPLVTVITNISLEHQEYLGDTLEAIAYEKAGIIKRGVPVVSAAVQPEVIRLFEQTCSRVGTKLHLLGRDFSISPNGAGFGFHGFGLSMDGLVPALAGPVQQKNTALAVSVLQLLKSYGFQVDESEMRLGLGKVQWPGRFQRIASDPTVVVDGAHNVGALEALRDTLAAEFSNVPVILVLGIMHDKDIAAMIRTIAPSAHEIICTRPAYSRAAEPEVLAEHAGKVHSRVSLVHDLKSAVETAKRRAADTGGVAVVAGSLFTVGETLALHREGKL